ncbi:HipA family kinase [Chromobacterium haemolyticum]|uniref:HipA family kinase n=1 Tax=Chromobacterium haemolyticum TaxID=394935 RepID=UPI0017469AA0|nr:HipA family kinase [Chromobacterium haemolyticum]QOD84836.1 hypothetical protein IEZ30_10310 [Chromobacterium haemolyticum]
MLDEINAVRFDMLLESGRTKPCLVTCEADDGEEVSVVVKLSIGCMEREHNLALEALSAMLATDLDLPVPNFYIVKIDDLFVDSMRGHSSFQKFNESCRLAFGSQHVQGFGPWITRSHVPKSLRQIAIEVFVFDCIIMNTDRRPGRPNCLFSGNQIAIIDHELSFIKELFWKPPFEIGGLDSTAQPDAHIFAPFYHDDKTPANLSKFSARWLQITDDRLQEYLDAIPPEWKIYEEKILQKIDYLKSVRDNIHQVVNEALKVFR